MERLVVTRRRVSNLLALAVLSTLGERPMHPYEISTTLRTRGKEQSIKLNYGSLYSVVEQLVRHELIRPRETTRSGRRPERTIYEITDAGLEELEDWLAELLSTPVREFTSLEAGLSLMPSLSPEEVVRNLDLRSDRLRIELGALEASFGVARDLGLPDLLLVESHYRRAMLTAELEYTTSLARDIRSDALSGTSVWRRMHELRAEGMPMEQILADPVRHLGEEARVLQPPEQ